MNHQDHVALLRNGVHRRGGVWADLGAGRGAFTLALAELVGPTATIYAVDRDRRALRQLAQSMQAQFPQVTLHTQTADFTNPLSLPPLDGVVMANALHFIRRKVELIQAVRSTLQADGRFLLVEYNIDSGNRWVPHPLSFSTWQDLARQSGFTHTELLATRPSRFLGEIYAAASW